MRFSIILISLILVSCKKELLVEFTPEKEESGLDVYLPEFILEEMAEEGSKSQWNMMRKKESQHFAVFWEEGFGTDPYSNTLPIEMRVDIDDLLSKAEIYFNKNIELGFAEVGNGNSYLDQYKLLIFLHYTEDWMATGAGYDDTIGAIWISPSTCQPVGTVIAHEIGHAFQYMVYCDLGGGSGYRYGFGPDGEGGNGFWEQTAQYQAFKVYPESAFNDVDCYFDESNKTFTHEDMRYCSYWMHFYWEQKHGIDFIGKLWRTSIEPEDPIQAYMRITNIGINEFHNEVFEAASRFVTWDLDQLRTLGSYSLNRYQTQFEKIGDKKYRIAREDVLSTSGFNHIRLALPTASTEITTTFQGIPNFNGFNQMEDPNDAGWKIGYVALLNNDERVYGPELHIENTELHDLSFTVPDNCKDIWLVITGAAKKYTPRPWVDPAHPDEHLPYQLEFKNVDLFR
jgi:hypothetical protein